MYPLNCVIPIALIKYLNFIIFFLHSTSVKSSSYKEVECAKKLSYGSAVLL